MRPRVGVRRKRSEPASASDASGRTPRRRQAQGNADQERERRPREGMLTKRGNAHSCEEEGLERNLKNMVLKTGFGIIPSHIHIV